MITIANILDKAELKCVQDQLRELLWREGALTAGRDAKTVKKNQQADLSTSDGQVLHEYILGRLKKHPVLMIAARPKAFTRLLISRTEGGGYYGAHIDNALMQTRNGFLRSDLSFTLFLSNPANYTGGELIIEFPGLSQSVKPNAGDLVLYPSTHIHYVNPVTRGQRIACVGWIESLVRDENKRETLFDLANLKSELYNNYPAHSPEMLVLNKTISNLLRLWSDP